MKKLLAFLMITISFPIIASAQTVSDKQYKNISNDLCNCVNKFSEKISQEFIDALTLSVNDENNGEEALRKYMEENPEKAMNEVMALDSLGKSIPKCIENLEKKYQNIYSTESEEQILTKLIEMMENNANCKLTYTFIQFAMKAEGK